MHETTNFMREIRHIKKDAVVMQECLHEMRMQPTLYPRMLIKFLECKWQMAYSHL